MILKLNKNLSSSFIYVNSNKIKIKWPWKIDITTQVGDYGTSQAVYKKSVLLIICSSVECVLM